MRNVRKDLSTMCMAYFRVQTGSGVSFWSSEKLLGPGRKPHRRLPDPGGAGRSSRGELPIKHIEGTLEIIEWGTGSLGTRGCSWGGDPGSGEELLYVLP